METEPNPQHRFSLTVTWSKVRGTCQRLDGSPGIHMSSSGSIAMRAHTGSILSTWIRNCIRHGATSGETPSDGLQNPSQNRRPERFRP